MDNPTIERYTTKFNKKIQSLYINIEISVRIKNKTSKNSRKRTQGVKQGCPLSPLLFNLYVDELTREWKEQLNTHYLLNDTTLDTLLFADDQIVVADSEDNMQRAIYKLEKLSKTYNLKISTKKTKV